MTKVAAAGCPENDPGPPRHQWPKLWAVAASAWRGIVVVSGGLAVLAGAVRSVDVLGDKLPF